jgi:UDP-N-acetylmuramate dehydrogenase
LVFSSSVPLFVIGNGSNVLVADGSHDVLAVHLTGEFAMMRWSDEGARVIVVAGAGLDLPVAARRLAAEGVTGFEWAVGVPGTFGGAVSMNAGGHGSDMAASVVDVRTSGVDGARVWSSSDLRLGYRTSALGSNDIVTEVRLRLDHGDAAASQSTIKEIVKWRRENQPGGHNGGSVFRNPPGDSAGRLLEASGCKGLRHESAVVSDKHANFILVEPDGRANDVFTLMGILRARVRETFGIELVSEHRLVGFGDDQ